MAWTSADNLRRMGGVAEYSFTETDPTTLYLEKRGTGLAISNNDPATILIITVRRTSGDITFRIKNNLNLLVSSFDKLDIIQVSASYDIIVYIPEGD